MCAFVRACFCVCLYVFEYVCGLYASGRMHVEIHFMYFVCLHKVVYVKMHMHGGQSGDLLQTDMFSGICYVM